MKFFQVLPLGTNSYIRYEPTQGDPCKWEDFGEGSSIDHSLLGNRRKGNWQFLRYVREGDGMREFLMQKENLLSLTS